MSKSVLLFKVTDLAKAMKEDCEFEDVRIRPGEKLHPKYLNDIIGQKAAMNISKGVPLDWNLINYNLIK